MTDQLSPEEREAYEFMERRAKSFGLWDEVRTAYENYRTAGDKVDRAAWCALYDWDI